MVFFLMEEMVELKVMVVEEMELVVD